MSQPAPGIEVRFVTGRRPEEATHLRWDDFDGPLALLLSLIEQRRLDVLTVRLGDLAGAYLEAVAGLDQGRLPLISSFVAVCAQLILIKSRALLPRPPQQVQAEEEGHDPEEELRQRLLLYRRYRDAARVLALRLESGGALFHREASAAAAAALAGASPRESEPLSVAALAEALGRTASLVPPPPPPSETIRRIVTLEERAAVIRGALRDAPSVVLQDLLSDVSDRVVVAVTFLALLELVKGRELRIEQRQPWGPIQISRLVAS